MKALLVSDLHLSDNPPSSCTETYTDDLFDLLSQTVAVARDRRVDVVVWAGDVFNLKAPSRTSHGLVQRTIKLAAGYPCPLYIVPGNHDLRHDRLDSISSQPLGVLLEAGPKVLDGWGDGPLYGVPWQQRWNDEPVSDALAGYRQVACSWQQVPPLERGTAPVHHLVVAHAPLYPPGKELPYEYFPAERWAQAMGGRGFCFYGHVHEPHGVYEAGGATFCNNGALSRGSLHEYNLDRQVGCTVWDSSVGEFEFVPLKAKPASEVFRLAEARELAESQERSARFLEEIGRTELGVVSVESVIEQARQLPQVSGTELALIEELLRESG